jgi:hypothetical protein
MAGRPSAATMAKLTERMDQLEKEMEWLRETQGANADPVVPAIKSTWSAELEGRVKKMEVDVEKISGFIKRMYSL